MQLPSETKPAIWGAICGAIVWWSVLAFGFGWTSAGTTLKIANETGEKAVIAALAPIVTLNDTRSWQRRELFPKDWVTLPGGSYPSSDLVDACSELILKPKTALKQ